MSAAAQIIDFTLASTGTSGEMIILTATSTSGLDVELNITNQSPTTGAADVATLDAGTGVLTLANPGTATITASQAGGTIGDITYGTATAVAQTITVGEATQTLVFTLADGTSGDRLPLSVTSQAGGVDIAAGLPAATYTSDAPDIAEVRGGQLVLLMDGTATITASRGGGTVGGVTYAPADDVTQDITVGEATQTLVFTLQPDGTSGESLNLTATSQDADGTDIAAGLPAVTYTSDAPDIAEVRGGQLVLLMDGTATITASRAGGICRRSYLCSRYRCYTRHHGVSSYANHYVYTASQRRAGR